MGLHDDDRGEQSDAQESKTTSWDCKTTTTADNPTLRENNPTTTADNPTLGENNPTLWERKTTSSERETALRENNPTTTADNLTLGEQELPDERYDEALIVLHLLSAL